jgi:hypothetical protein
MCLWFEYRLNIIKEEIHGVFAKSMHGCDSSGPTNYNISSPLNQLTETVLITKEPATASTITPCSPTPIIPAG